jgi:hypothetical protein
VSSFSTSTDGLQGLTKTFGLLPLRLCEQTGRVLQAIPSGPGNLSPGKRAEIGGEISHADEAADRGKHGQAAGAVREGLIAYCGEYYEVAGVQSVITSGCQDSLSTPFVKISAIIRLARADDVLRAFRSLCFIGL